MKGKREVKGSRGNDKETQLWVPQRKKEASRGIMRGVSNLKERERLRERERQREAEKERASE